MGGLSEAQREQFLSEGHVVIEGALDPDLVREQVTFGWQRLGVDPQDPATWGHDKIHMPSRDNFPWQDHAPRAWAAMGELCGGADRVRQPCGTGNGFIVNFSWQADQGERQPCRESGGWHKDGDFFRHFLDSPEQGLLTLVIWTDILPHSGGTYFIADSVGPVARFLADHPEGVLPREIDYDRILGQCSDYREVTAKAGDIVLLHPYTIHASSPNPSGRPRVLTNPCVQLVSPMVFDRAEPLEHSLVEQATLRGLGLDRYPFRPTTERERVVPERVARQQKLREAEDARLAGR